MGTDEGSSLEPSRPRADEGGTGMGVTSPILLYQHFGSIAIWASFLILVTYIISGMLAARGNKKNR